MKCPVCDVELLMTDRQGIEIDYCSKCRGIWLDRGELDKIIERSKEDNYDRPNQHHSPNNESYHKQGHYHDNHSHQDYHYKKHKKESLLEKIFDFD